jgi:hypothetical protein
MCVVIMLGALMAILSLQFILDVLVTVPSRNFLHSVLGVSFTDRLLAYFVSTQRLIVYHHHHHRPLMFLSECPLSYVVTALISSYV